MEQFGVYSEVGKLRKVIVRRRSSSLKRLTPSNHDDPSFDECCRSSAPMEHDQFVAAMRGRGVQVFLLQDLLGEALSASDEARRKIIERVASEYTVGWSLVDEVRDSCREMKPDLLAKRLIGGLTVGEMDLDLGKLKEVSLGAAAERRRWPGYFVLPPVPNSLFTRDSSCWMFNGVSVDPMYWPARRRNRSTCWRSTATTRCSRMPTSSSGTGTGGRWPLQRPGLRPRRWRAAT